HTRFSRDWSSDVCSSDLAPSLIFRKVPVKRVEFEHRHQVYIFLDKLHREKMPSHIQHLTAVSKTGLIIYFYGRNTDLLFSVLPVISAFQSYWHKLAQALNGIKSPFGSSCGNNDLLWGYTEFIPFFVGNASIFQEYYSITGVFVGFLHPDFRTVIYIVGEKGGHL